MKKTGDNYLYSPSDLITFMESEYASWMERYYLEFPGKITPDQDDELKLLLQETGNAHEKAYLQKLRDAGKDICEIERGDTDTTTATTATLEAIRTGREVIYQAALRLDNFAGYADFLVRENNVPNTNGYLYQVWDTKLALNPKPYFLIQLCCYAEMLAAIQGELPKTIGVVLGDDTQKIFRTEDFYYYYLCLKEAFLEKQAAFDPNNPPEPTGMEDNGRWISYAEKRLEESDHLSRVANIRKVQIKKLYQAGITTMKQLAATDIDHIPNMEQGTLNVLKQQARLQVASIGCNSPAYEHIQPDASDPRRGLAILPPASAADVCFDMEGYPHIEDGLEYLFGVSYLEDNKLQYKDWWGHNRHEERSAFERFIDWVHARWKNNPSMHIFHYGAYETSRLRSLMGLHATREREVDELLRNEVFVDLFTVVRQSLRVGTSGYSLKDIEKLYKTGRGGDVATAADSLVQYAHWRVTKDGNDHDSSKILANIRDYNREDCESTWQLLELLRKHQVEQGVSFIAKPEKPQKENEQALARDQAAELAVQLLSSLPEGEQNLQRRNLQELLAHLLEFHWREAKPVFWAKYDRAEMTEIELIEDKDCLGGLTRTNSQPRAVKKSRAYEYSFDPAQDTKLEAGDKCFFAHDLTKKCTIESIDSDRGLIEIKIGPSQPEDPPMQLNLIPDEYISADVIAGSIYDTVSSWVANGKLPTALEDFLLRRRPRIKGNPAGPIIPTGSEILDGAVSAIANLDNSTLCIQGPPGSGKTFTAAAAILELLKQGKRVGVSSHSHKAIAKLLQTVAAEAQKRSVNLYAAKIQSDDGDFYLDGTSIRSAKNIEQALDGGYQLIGGTAWAFSKACAIGEFDYLFVDEAGQVSIGHLAGMARSTNNVVLVGDQMQLSQPIKGSHPGESGRSALQYLLQEHQTILEDFGIFLPVSRRMHPHVCDFISSAVYEGRLTAMPETAHRVLTLPETLCNNIDRSAGIVFVPVEHEDNTQASKEEADVIACIVQELLACQIADGGGDNSGADGANRKVQLNDILIVAPYNMQVGYLRKAVPGVDIGTVDKFQGQEKPIVILSMAASSGEASLRGIEFLFNRNRINVAISRAQTLAIVVGHPVLTRTPCSSVEQVQLVNLFCRVAHVGRKVGVVDKAPVLT